MLDKKSIAPRFKWVKGRIPRREAGSGLGVLESVSALRSTSPAGDSRSKAMNARLACTLLCASAAPLFAQQTPQQLADAELPSLIAIYKDLHMHPELSGQEEKSAALVAK